MTPPSVRVRAALADALALLLPVDCAGCGTLDVTLCAQCRRALHPQPRPHEGTALAVWAGTMFDGPAARVMRALKEDGRTGLARALAPALAAAVQRVCEDAGMTPAGVLVVPVPTSPAALRRRGYRVSELLARRAGLRPVRLLGTAGAARDQRGLGREDRAANVRDTFRVTRHVAPASGRRVLLVDDVVTTGATLHEAARVLAGAGFPVIGAAAVAATPRRMAASSITPRAGLRIT